MATTRLLKAILPASCLWTSLRDSEGYTYDETLNKLKELYPAEEESSMDCEDDILSDSVPQSIRDMVGHKGAMEALGAMIWCVSSANTPIFLDLNSV